MIFQSADWCNCVWCDVRMILLQWQGVVDEDQSSREPSAAEAEEVFPGVGN